MKIMKNILLLAALSGGLTMTSCSGSFLDEDMNPNYLSPATFWKSEGDIMKGLTAAYGGMQPNASWAVPYERYIVIDNYRSDECIYRADVSSWMAMANFTNESTGSVSRKEWTNLYKGINYANQCLDNIPNVPESSSEVASLKKQAIAEARFLRAFYYYRLYINFGEIIPIFLHQLEGTEEEFYPNQAAPGEVVDLIEKELTEVQADLPEKYDADNGGRATRYAAAALLGKFYMFRHELKKAEAEFKKLIGKFELVDNYYDNFDGMHENNKESILEVQFTGDVSGGHSEYNVFAIHLASFNAIYDGYGGYEEAYPSEWLYNTLMADKTVDGKHSDRAIGTIIFDDPACRPFYYEKGKSFSDYHSEGEYFWHKYVHYDPSLGPYWDNSGFNVPLIRYADVLLLYAECLNDRGETAEAIGYINQVRDRVNVPALPLDMSKDAVLKHLQDVERPCELALEGSRWYDLVRWGIVENTLKDHKKPNCENFVATKHTLLPIPHDEFLLNPDWKQNEGYSK